MRWLMHGPLTTAAADALRRHKHEAKLAADAGVPPDAGAAAVFEAAAKQQLDVITADGALAAAAYAEGAKPFPRSVVFLNVAAGDVEQDDAVDRLFKRYPRLTPGRLYTVTNSRVKIRQLPTQAR